MHTKLKIIAVIPAYNCEGQIEATIKAALPYVDGIIVVDDASTDSTKIRISGLCDEFLTLKLVEHELNKGVGGAMKTGFQYALEQGAEVVVKIDGDGQMDPSFIPEIVLLLQKDEIDMVKGNRFYNIEYMYRMPLIRRIGNLGLGFLVKAASGYWEIFDPSNGYIAIKCKGLSKMRLAKLADRYFFESSLLIEAYYSKLKIADLPMPSIYNDEKSNLSITRVLFGFPPRLARAFIRRIWLRYFVLDFNIGSLFLITGFPLFIFGSFFGGVKWYKYASLGVPAPTGTIVVALATLILGFQLILSAIQYDIEKGKL